MNKDEKPQDSDDEKKESSVPPDVSNVPIKEPQEKPKEELPGKKKAPLKANQ